MAKTISKLYVGIDPGLHGAIAAVTDDSLVGIWDTPITRIKSGKKKRTKLIPEQMTLLVKGLPIAKQTVVGIELVRAMPGQGVVSMFSMGYGLGVWEGIIAALGLTSAHITPVSWKKAMLQGDGKDKSVSILQAQRLMPSAASLLTRKKDDGRAEALLMALYLRRTWRF